MQRLFIALISFFSICLISGCSSVPDNNWTHLVNENVSFVITPEPGMKLSDITAKEYSTYLEDLTPVALQQLTGLDDQIPNSLNLKALVSFPATSTESHFLWIGEHTSANIAKWAPQFYEPFKQNNYRFNGFTIHKLFFNKTDIYAAQAGKWLILSTSSLVIESALRTYLGQLPNMTFNSEPAAGSLTLNTPQLDKWLEQFATTNSRPSLINSFAGTNPIEFNFSAGADTAAAVEFSGKINLNDEAHSTLTDAISFENKPVILDRHIGSNAAAFALFRLPPASIPSTAGNAGKVDSLLHEDLELYQRMAGALENEFAFVAFPESGLLTTGEYLFMRTMKDASAFRNNLNRLVEQRLITRSQSTYQIQSSVISKLVGSELSPFQDFYLSFSGSVVVIARRKGLAESVNADRIRRRVIYYDENYEKVRNNLPNEVSGFVWSASKEVMKFLQPYLKSDNVVGSLVNRFDITTLTMTAQDNAVDVAINTYAKEGSRQPYEEQWVVPMNNFELSAKPVLGDLVGSRTNEIIFSTRDGRVLVLAADGTITMQTTTNGLEPIGGPVLYDWYGNGQKIILLAAGKQIFAWNSSGNLLPKFPLKMDANITAPILVTDVLRNGVPEIVVATEDRKVHVLDGRGENVRGWPKNTNAPVTSQPVYEQLESTWGIWAFSQNAIHSWLRNGASRPGYPQFINARFTGSPVIHKNQVLAGAADGYLYSIGAAPFFEDSVSSSFGDDDISINSMYVADSELTSVSIEENVLLKNETNFYRNDLISTQSVNGSIFLYNTDGELRFTQSLGQPASNSLHPHLEDINSDRKMELIALAEFGRLYAWEILTNQRLYSIPTSGMKHPIISDLNGDGRKELIAQTREGLRCWTINAGD